MRALGLLVALVPGIAGAGTVVTRSGHMLDLPEVYVPFSELGAQFLVHAESDDGFAWQLQAALPADDPDRRTFDLELRGGGHEAGTAAVVLGSGNATRLVNVGAAHLEMGDGRIRVQVDTQDPDAAATLDADLYFECFPPHDQDADGLDEWLQTPFCKHFRDLLPSGQPQDSDDATLGAGMSLFMTAALIEGTVTKAEETYDECAGPRREVTLTGVVTHAGGDVGRTVVLKEFGGRLPDGAYLIPSNATAFARGGRYLVQLADDSMGRWFRTPVVVGNALLVRNVRGKDVLLTQYGELVFGFGGEGWGVGPVVAEPNYDIANPFDPPVLLKDIPQDVVDWAVTPEEAVREFVDFSVRHEIPIEGTFHPDPDPMQNWRSSGKKLAERCEAGGCSCSSAGGDALAGGLLLLAGLMRRRRVQSWPAHRAGAT